MKTLPSKWEGKMDKDQVHLFESKVPHYNKVSKVFGIHIILEANTNISRE